MNIRLFALYLISATSAFLHETNAQSPTFKYRGIYDGDLSVSTTLWIVVRDDSRATFTLTDSLVHRVFTGSFPISADGSFSYSDGFFRLSGTFTGSGVTGGASFGSLFSLPKSQLGTVSGKLQGVYSGWFYLMDDTVAPIQNVELVFTSAGRVYGTVTQSAVSPELRLLGFRGFFTPDGHAFISEIGQGVPATATFSQSNGSLDGSIAVISPKSGINWYLKAIRENVDQRMANISTRGKVGTGPNVLIAGFTIKNGPKQVVVRALGPSLNQPPFHLPGVLANPKLDLFSATSLVSSNNDWQSAINASDLQATGLAPTNSLESALLVTLSEGEYTVRVSGVGESTGIALVEVYEID